MTSIKAPIAPRTPSTIASVENSNVERGAVNLGRVAPKSAPASVRDSGRVRVGGGLRRG